jgi:hypothetical protein
VKKTDGRGGARKGAGRKKRAGYRQTSVAMPLESWKRVKRLAARRKKSGEKDVSAARVAGELVQSALVYFGLEDEKRLELEAIAAERGVTLEALIQAAVSEFLAKRSFGGRSEE